MSEAEQSSAVEERLAAEALIVDVDGYEGPLDLLLMLSRTQKVDLRRISILHLAEQYLAFINRAETLRIELAPRLDVRLVCPGFVRSRLTAKNDFPMPAMIEPEEAAAAVLAGLRSRAFEIHFPKRFTYAMKLLRALPYWLSLRLTGRLR